MKLIKKINKLLKWAPEDILYTTSTRYSTYKGTPYTEYDYTEIGEWVIGLPLLISILLLFVFYVITYLLYFTFIKIPWWIFIGLFIPQKVLK
jgi:hypothetical protein